MSYRDDERRWRLIQDMLAAEAGGKTVRPAVSQRTLFGIPSTVEQAIERIVAQDEEERRMKRQRAKETRLHPEQSEGSAMHSREEGPSPSAQDGKTGIKTRVPKETEHVEHPLDPVFDERSHVLLLGTMPSPASREAGFYYGHPLNRFWRVLAELFDEPVATTNERRRDQLLRHHVALWDVLASCDINGASDASIADAAPNDLSRILDAAPIEAVFCTGAKAAELYERHCEAATGMPCTKLPSTSPANAAVKFDELVEAYRNILPHLHEEPPRPLDVADVVALEQAIATAGTPLSELMDRAGLAIAHRVHQICPQARVAILCGNGNNGGDGWVAARELLDRGHDVALASLREPCELKAQPARDTALSVQRALSEHGVDVLIDPDIDLLGQTLAASDVIIDAILGTGFTGDTVKAPLDSWILQANAQRARGAHVVAADTPSGLNAQTGTPSSPCIEADETITMIAPKTGLGQPGASRFTGRVRVAPLAYIEPFQD